jgi:hypothetical protein
MDNRVPWMLFQLMLTFGKPLGAFEHLIIHKELPGFIQDDHLISCRHAFPPSRL